MAQRSVGIVGAGQLAQMLAQAAKKRAQPLNFCFLASHANEPALNEGGQAFVGDVGDAGLLKNFFAASERIIFENEFFPSEFEKRAEELVKDEARFAPSLKTLKILRNKLFQKLLLNELHIPNSPFVIWGMEDAPEFLKKCRDEFGDDYVLKWGLGGYDGKGVLLPSEASRALDFLKEARAKNFPVYAEKKIKFRQEWAVIACRSTQGQLVFFPFVQSEQRKGICYEVQGSTDLSAAQWKKLGEVQDWIRKLAEKVNLVGSFGVELFLDEDGSFWINELAPRVHNSGHYTQDAFVVDQFDAHLKAVLGEELTKPEAKFPYWGMINLLGPEGSRAPAKEPEILKGPQLFTHWYQKAELRAGRKMGHLNWVAKNKTEAEAVRRQALDWVQNWEKGAGNG